MKETTVDTLIKTEWYDFFKHCLKSKYIDHEGILAVERRIIYAAYHCLRQKGKVIPTRVLQGETAKYHISGETSVYDTIKAMASYYRRPFCTNVIYGVGSFPISQSNQGAAPRYTHVTGTPLLYKIFDDMEFFDYCIHADSEQPRTIVYPFPVLFMSTQQAIAIGKSFAIHERDEREIRKWGEEIINTLFPSGSTYPARYKEKFMKSLDSIKTVRDMSSIHVGFDNYDIKLVEDISTPLPVGFGYSIDYNQDTKEVTMRGNMSEKNRRIWVEGLPVYVSDLSIRQKIIKLYGQKVADKMIDKSSKEHPILFCLPPEIEKTDSKLSSLGIIKSYKENYIFWNEEHQIPIIYNKLHRCLIEWYLNREKILTRKFMYKNLESYKKIEKYKNIIAYHDMILEYNEDIPLSLLKEKFGASLPELLSLPQKTYTDMAPILKGIEEEEKKIAVNEKTLANLKDYIFKEWDETVEENIEWGKQKGVTEKVRC